MSSPVIFVETLRGSLREGGAEHPIEVEILAQAPSRAALLRNGWLAVRGLVRAPRWVAEAPVRGSLRIQPHALTYQLVFEATDGGALELEGLKRPSVWAPLRSMTTLPAVLRTEDAVVVARGELRFDLGELIPFLLGWLGWLPTSVTTRRELDARRRAAERRALGGAS